MKRALPLSSIISLFLFPSISYTQVQLDWAKKFVGSGNDNAAAIAADNSGNIWICGNNNWGYSTADMYTVRYNSSGLQTAGYLYNSPYNNADQAKAIATDPAGNVYVCGKISLNASTSDIIVIKYNSSATQQWVAYFNTPQNWIDDAVAITTDAAGNVYMTGSVVKYEPFEYDYLTVKFNTSGVLQWYATYNGTANGVDMANDIAVDAAGNVYVTGLSSGQIRKGRGDLTFIVSTGYDVVTIKYNASGTQQWVQRYNASNLNDEGKAIGLDAAGDVYVTGLASASSSNQNAVTIKYNNAGAFLWQQTYAGPAGSHDFANDLAVDGSGNVLIAGGTFNSAGRSDVLAIKYNTSGVQQWLSTYDAGSSYHDLGNKMALDDYGNMYIAGESAIPGVTSSDYITVKFASNGVRAWAARYNGPENGYDRATGIVVKNPVSSFPGTFSNANVFVIGSSNSDVVTLKYSQPILIGSKTELEPEVLAASFKVNNYPNPFDSYTNITYELPEDSRVTINVFDVAGRKVSTLVNGLRNAGLHVARFDAGKLPAGTYHYQYVARSANREFTETKIIVLQR